MKLPDIKERTINAFAQAPNKESWTHVSIEQFNKGVDQGFKEALEKRDRCLAIKFPEIKNPNKNAAVIFAVNSFCAQDVIDEVRNGNLKTAIEAYEVNRRMGSSAPNTLRYADYGYVARRGSGMTQYVNMEKSLSIPSTSAVITDVLNASLFNVNKTIIIDCREQGTTVEVPYRIAIKTKAKGVYLVFDVATDGKGNITSLTPNLVADLWQKV